MAGETFGTRRNGPLLRDGAHSVGDGEAEVGAAIGHEERLVTAAIPRIADAVDAGVILHEEARFDALFRGGVATFESKIEMFHPNCAAGQSPITIHYMCKI